MKRSRCLGRRAFFHTAAGSAALGSAISCSRAPSKWRFFTDEEAAAIGAICDQIIPPDEDPGAVQAGVVEFLDRQLKGHYRYLQDAYRQGIREVDEAAAAMHGQRFALLTAGQQLTVLKDREKTAFFRMVVDHTMQGFYGDPRHGGNRDFASWRMLGIPNPPVRGREQYDLTKG